MSMSPHTAAHEDRFAERHPWRGPLFSQNLRVNDGTKNKRKGARLPFPQPKGDNMDATEECCGWP